MKPARVLSAVALLVAFGSLMLGCELVKVAVNAGLLNP